MARQRREQIEEVEEVDAAREPNAVEEAQVPRQFARWADMAREQMGAAHNVAQAMPEPMVWDVAAPNIHRANVDQAVDPPQDPMEAMARGILEQMEIHGQNIRREGDEIVAQDMPNPNMMHRKGGHVFAQKDYDYVKRILPDADERNLWHHAANQYRNRLEAELQRNIDRQRDNAIQNAIAQQAAAERARWENVRFDQAPIFDAPNPGRGRKQDVDEMPTKDSGFKITITDTTLPEKTDSSIPKSKIAHIEF